MRKLVIAATAAAVVGAVTFKPAPAQAMVMFLPFVLLAKEDKNFKAVNPYAPTKAKAKASKKKKK